MAGANVRYIGSCEECPFAKWQGYHYPVEMWCECPGTPRDQAVVVFSRASGWWYKTPPVSCPLRKGVSFKVSRTVEVGK